MQKIISMILAFIMSLLGLAPAVAPEDAYTQAQWYAKVVDAFNLTADLDDGDNYDMDATDEYYEVIQACHDWNVLVGEYDGDAAVTDFVVAKSLAVVTGAESSNGVIVTKPDDVALEVAIEVGFVKISANIFGKYKESVISKDNADAALDAAVVYTKNAHTPYANGGTVTVNGYGEMDLQSLSLVENSAGLTLQTADGKVINEDEITALDYEGSVNPFEQPEIAGINQQSILDKINVDFNIGGLNVYAGLKDGGVDFKLSGELNGSNITKTWELRDFNIDTKFEGNLSVNEIKRSYLILDYKLTDTTTATTSKAWSLDESALPEGSDDVDFFARVKNNLFEMKEGGNSEIDVFSVDVAIPNCPAITVGITAKLIVTFDGRVDLVIVSNETRGVEVIDNKVRVISESESDDWNLTAQARVEAKLGLYVDLSIVSITLLDAGIEVGLGVHVTLYMTGGTSDYTLEMPYDYLMDINFNFPNSENLTATVNVKIYGIVTISVGENSIIEKIGLSKTWKICTEENATFYDQTFVLKEA